MEIIIFISLALTAALLIGSWPVYAKLRTVPEATSDSDFPDIRITIIIPARNEENNLAVLLPTISKQSTSVHEVIVVDDNSTDRTAEVAADSGARVVKAPPLPAGWKGKPWALTKGAEVASGDWILFLDADTTLEQGAIRNLTLLSRQPDRVYSICPYHTISRSYEQLSAFFNVIMVLGTNAFTLKGAEASRTGLFGQVLFVGKSNYDRVGGHEAVKDRVLENFDLAAYFQEAGLKCCSYLGRGSGRMRMFPAGLQELIESWSKGFVSGAESTPPLTMAGVSLWLTGLIMAVTNTFYLPFASAPALVAIPLLYLLAMFTCLYLFKRVGNFSAVTALFYPFPLLFYMYIFFRSKSRRKKRIPTEWKGRDVL